MAADIVPELYERIKDKFEQNMKADKELQGIKARLKKETATGEDICRYSKLVGTCAADALTAELIPGNLPEGRLYWNIASRIIEPLLREVHKMVMTAATKQWEYADKKLGIGMKCVETGFPEDRVKDLIDKIMEYWEDDINEQ